MPRPLEPSNIAKKTPRLNHDFGRSNSHGCGILYWLLPPCWSKSQKNPFGWLLFSIFCVMAAEFTTQATILFGYIIIYIIFRGTSFGNPVKNLFVSISWVLRLVSHTSPKLRICVNCSNKTPPCVSERSCCAS